MTTQAQAQAQATKENLQAFIESHDDSVLIANDQGGFTNSESRWNMNKELALALIKQLGGDDEFLESYEDAKRKDPDELVGFFFETDALNFFDQNRTNILDGVKRHAERVNVDTAIGMMGVWFDEHDSIGMDDIAAAIHEPVKPFTESSFARQEVCLWLAQSAASEVCHDFINYLDDCE